MLEGASRSTQCSTERTTQHSTQHKRNHSVAQHAAQHTARTATTTTLPADMRMSMCCAFPCYPLRKGHAGGKDTKVPKGPNHHSAVTGTAPAQHST